MGFQGGITLSKREEYTVNVIADYRAGKLTRKEAAERLECSERKVTRLVQRIEAKGLQGVLHGNLNKEPKNKTDKELKTRVLQLVREKYLQFNMTHCLEMLAANEKIKVSYAVFQRWCAENNLKKIEYRRRTPRHYRDRLPAEGALLQMDGSPHKWNGKDDWVLINVIDDATSKLMHSEFFTSEDTLNCMSALASIIETSGIPDSLYVDRAGLYGGTAKRKEFSQFGRACQELGIHLIFANSAQGKGRVERSFKTCQDRLIAELAYHKITTIPEANKYLQEHFVKRYWNQRNTVVPRNKKKKFRELPEDININEVLCLKDKRKVLNNHTITIGNELYRVEPPNNVSIAGRNVEIRTYTNLKWKVFYGGIELKVTKILVPLKKSASLLNQMRAETVGVKIAG